MASHQLHKQIAAFATALAKAQNTRRHQRLENARLLEERGASGQGLQGLPFSPDVAQLLEGLRAYINRQKQRYAAPPPAAEAGQVAAPPVPQPDSAFIQETAAALAPLLQPQAASADDAELPPDMHPAVKFYLNLLHEEMHGFSTENSTLGNNLATILPRLQQAKKAILAGRMQDAATILRTASKANPHSHLLLYLLSQFLYLLHQQGNQGLLPEARELAQKSIIATDKMTPEQLMPYRFHAIVTELGHEPARALEWLRDTNLLAPALLATSQGWQAHGNLPLLAWPMLAAIPVELWKESEFRQMHDLVRNVPGGGLLYLFYLRAPLAAYAATCKEPLPLHVATENMLGTSWLLYQAIALPLAQLAATSPGGSSWTVRTRFMHAVATLCPVPGFDHVLLHIALDGRATAGGYPDPYLRHALADPNIGYWNLWAGCLAPEREARLAHLLPADETLEDIESFNQLGELHGHLRAAENALIKRELWAELQPWMARYQLDHLLAAGTGSNRPRMRFTPALPPYSTYYRRWSEANPTNVLASDIIAENAKNGAFASLFEAQAAFEGAYRLLHDPAHGLVAAQKRALATAMAANPAKYKNASIGGGGGPALKGMLLLGLFGAGMAASVSLTENAGQAIGMGLVVAGLVGMLAIQMAKPSAA